MADGILISDNNKKKSSKTLKYIILAVLVTFIFFLIIFSGESDTTASTSKKEKNVQKQTTLYEEKAPAVNEMRQLSETAVEANENEALVSDESVMKNAEVSTDIIEYEPYVIKKGDCLTKIAKELYGASIYWTQILDKNREKIADPDTIFAGQTIMVPVISKENPQWDKTYLVQTYVDTYKIYKELEKVESVKFMLISGVKRIDPNLVEHYKQEINEFNKAYAGPQSMLGNPSPSVALK